MNDQPVRLYRRLNTYGIVALVLVFGSSYVYAIASLA